MVKGAVAQEGDRGHLDDVKNEEEDRKWNTDVLYYYLHKNKKQSGVQTPLDRREQESRSPE